MLQDMFFKRTQMENLYGMISIDIGYFMKNIDKNNLSL